MEQKKEQTKEGGRVVYSVAFYPYETVYLKHIDLHREKKHFAKVMFTGLYYFVVSVDGRHANSLCYRSAKTAVRNCWFI